MKFPYMASSTVLPGNRQGGAYTPYSLRRTIMTSEIVKIHLRDTNVREVIPNRTIHLQPPSFELKIGRGSQTDEHLHPSPWNAWFTSRVMSREHAIVRADPITRRVTIQDTGSMHGTFVDGARLEQDQVFLLDGDDKIQLGAEIVRGDQTYKPLELSLRVEWTNPVVISTTRPMHLISSSKNSFSADYGSDDESVIHDDDSVVHDDIELVYESIRIPSEEPTRQSRTFSVPDSDVDDVEDVTEDRHACLIESPPTSPEDVNKVDPKKDNPLPNTVDNETQSKHDTASSAGGVAGSTVQTALNVSDSEEDLECENEEIASEDEEPTGYSSEEDQDFLDDDIGSRSSQRNDDSDVDDDDDEEGQQAFDDSHLPGSRIANIQIPNENYPRRPSPSDCAMPKPSWYPNENLPNIQSLVGQVAPPNMVFGDAYPAGTPTFPPFQSVGCCGTMTWPLMESSANFTGSYDQGYNVPQLPSFSSAMPEFARLCNPSAQELATPSAIQPDSTSSVAKDGVVNKTSKVSINNIIEDTIPDSASSSRRKRKADEISASSPADIIMWSRCKDAMDTEDVALNHESSENPTKSSGESADCSTSTAEVQDDLDADPEKPTSSEKLVAFCPENAAAVETNPDTERPQKRSKVHHNGQSNHLIKYVATAMAGAALGAVGTVFGLAALPADYFA